MTHFTTNRAFLRHERLDSLNIFEQLNNASVNVYGIEKLYQNGQQNYEIVGPLYYTRCKKPIHINLLLISDDDSNQHYCTIKDLSKLVSSQITKRNGKSIYVMDVYNIFEHVIY